MQRLGSSNVAATCGSLLIAGFAGTSLPPPFARALGQRRRGGAILFRPNVEGGPRQIAALGRELAAAWAAGEPNAPPVLVGIDQEGGRVARVAHPLLCVPPMRTVASWGDAALATRIATAVGRELAALGITLDFAPVLDVNTCAHNPVIGDRAFGDDAASCARFGVAWTLGLQGAGILACGKHFPGHGDTAKDSHIDLPVVDQPLARLERVELVPFRAAVEAGVASLMTAHVVYPALDAERPATLSPAVCTTLRQRIGFDGMLVSDDLEMRAVAARRSVSEAAVLAVAAGCDALLVCWNDGEQERAFEALVHEAEGSPAFRARCEQAAARVRAAARRVTARPLDDEEMFRVVGGPESTAIARAIEERTSVCAAGSASGGEER